MKQVILLTGKSKSVFKFLSLLAQYKGSKTLKDIQGC